MKIDEIDTGFAAIIRKHLKCCQSNKGFISTLCLSNRSKLDYALSSVKEVINDDFWLKHRIAVITNNKYSAEISFKGSASKFIIRSFPECAMRQKTNGMIIDRGIDKVAAKRKIKPFIKPYLRFKPKSRFFIWLWYLLKIKIKSIEDDLIIREYFDYIDI